MFQCVLARLGLSLAIFALLLGTTVRGDETASSANEESVAESGEGVGAHADLFACEDPTRKVGTMQLSERPSDQGIKIVDVRLSVNDQVFTPGKHGVHIHETGNCQPCSAAKGHFDPGPDGNTNPDGNHPFHMGELPNVIVDENGAGELVTQTSRLTISPGRMSIFDDDGSAVIVHENEDTFCPNGPEPGCAGGGRAACGVLTQVE